MSSDWDSVTILRKKESKTGTVKTNAQLNEAMKSGTLVSTAKSVSNQKETHDSRKAFKIDNETEDFHIEKVKPSVGKAIQQARQEKGLSQKDLATKINEKPQVVNDYEGGRAANPSQLILGKMERVLGVKLRGKDIGSKFGK